jgi:DNA-directed RNA polymerase subunit RPC12/RpoP
MGGVDITLGLKDLGDRIFACPACGQRYERGEDLAEPPYMFQDYDMYYFRKLEPVLTRPKPPVPPPKEALPSSAPPRPRPPVEDGGSYLRCPQCRSWEIKSENWYDLTRYACQTCGHHAFVDWTDREEWNSAEQDREDARKAALAKSTAR